MAVAKPAASWSFMAAIFLLIGGFPVLHRLGEGNRGEISGATVTFPINVRFWETA